MTAPHLPPTDPNGPIEEADLAVAEKLVPAAETPLIRALGAATDLSDQEPLYAATAAFAVTGIFLRDLRSFRAGTEMLAAHLFATALRGIVKQLVDRTRPIAAAHRGRYELRDGQRYESDFNSFPSGHSAGALAVAATVARQYPIATGPALALAGATAVAQVVRSKHFVTDVLAGAAIGWVAAALIGQLVGRAERT
ncbi:phosphatase PAP2 family protein [Sphingomonas sp. KRR8]|uniref:phosphatase PAP2 family protein n=1 Tax=Sphingomonas sp. KRR8 TaxID=2942996 RepID=UPI00201FECCE|nr:phosphatase PAP2 family protein [Sphingomonas sp. KRR8]URD61792.1 phosphatase PAP2 family protein [Sphingomonas sp. KRR8]